MTDVLSLALHIGLVVTSFGLLAALDVSRRERVPGWWWLALAAAWVVRVGIGALVMRSRGFGPHILTAVEAGAAEGVAVTFGVGAAALAASRSFRAAPARWRPWRLGLAVLALAAIPIHVAAVSRPSWPALWLSWSALPMVLAFARDGDRRLDRGAAAALGLLWVGAAAWICAGALQELAVFLFTLQVGGRVVYPWATERAAPAVVWVVFWTTLAVGRWPDPRAAVVALPAILVQLPLWLRLLAPNPVFGLGPDRLPQAVDLGGARVDHRLVAGSVPPCVSGLDEPVDHVGHPASLPHPWVLPPDRSLADAPVGEWVVYQDLWPKRLGYGTVDVSAARYPPDRTVRVREQGGLAVVDGGPALPLDGALVDELRSRPPPEPGRVLHVEIEITPRWTVQQAVSICASAFTDEVRHLECLLVAPPTVP